MNLGLILVLVLSGGAQAAGRQTALVPPDPVPGWFAEDKLKHFVASFVVTSVSASASRTAGLERNASLGFGAGVSVAAGLLKERHDSRAGGAFSGADLAWDAAGIGTSLLLLRAGN